MATATVATKESNGKGLNPQAISNGQEQHTSYPHPFKRGKMLCQYDYRHTNGKLFSCVSPTLDACRAKRDAWLANNEGGSHEYCGASLDRREISWRLKFLALMMGEYSQMDFSLGEEEYAGLMFILMDIAGMVSPESEKAGAA